jgi:hypothetical protein
MPENPWAGMPSNSKRRIEEWSERNLFWITDIKGAYGFNIQSSEPFDDSSAKLRLKGIDICKRNNDAGADFFLVLSKNDDWQIFQVLCSDLISAAINTKSDRAMISAIEARLRRWQQLLKSDLQRQLTIETQMGLFSELLCLRDVIGPQIGLGNAVRKWGGPDSDKQDFVCDASAVEVKSYVSSKGPTVTISSAQQLWSDKESLYLVAYGLSQSDTGETVEDLDKEILVLLERDDDARELFEAKVGRYGFVPELNIGELVMFVSDARRFYLISESFPRINPGLLAGEIAAVRYVVDLARCSRFEVAQNDLSI